MINSRKIEDLHERVQVLCNQFIAKCQEAGIKVLITATYRDIEYQNSLYAIGRTKPGKRVTRAKGGQSFHNYKVAFDFVPMVNGECAWNDTLLFVKCGRIGTDLGLTWGGDFKSIKDMPHFEFTGGLTLADFQSGKTI